jgi:transposase
LAFLEEEEIELLPWPLRSPDLSPIEKVWDTMGRFIYNLSYPPITLEEVQGAIAEAWEGTPQEFIDDAMPRRIQGCIRERGGSTNS